MRDRCKRWYCSVDFEHFLSADPSTFRLTSRTVICTYSSISHAVKIEATDVKVHATVLDMSFSEAMYRVKGLLI